MGNGTTGQTKTFSPKNVELCKLLSHMLKNIPTEDGPMEVMWMRVMTMPDSARLIKLKALPASSCCVMVYQSIGEATANQ